MKDMVVLAKVEVIDKLRFALLPSVRMRADLFGSFATLFASCRRRAALQIEILALRHQLGVLQRSVKRPKLSTTDRIPRGMVLVRLERLAD